jgi:putative FmdB family regulatory protein
MPIYEYRCKTCKEEFTILQGINTKAEETRCPKCGSQEVQKKVSAFSCCSLGNGRGLSSLSSPAGFGAG